MRSLDMFDDASRCNRVRVTGADQARVLCTRLGCRDEAARRLGRTRGFNYPRKGEKKGTLQACACALLLPRRSRLRPQTAKRLGSVLPLFLLSFFAALSARVKGAAGKKFRARKGVPVQKKAASGALELAA